MKDGERVKRGAPCLSNEGAFGFIMKNIRTKIERALNSLGPDKRRWIASISQGDFGRICHCPECEAAYKRHGGSWVGACGGLMEFVNKAAADLEKDYPDMLVDTLA